MASVDVQTVSLDTPVCVICPSPLAVESIDHLDLRTGLIVDAKKLPTGLAGLYGLAAGLEAGDSCWIPVSEMQCFRDNAQILNNIMALDRRSSSTGVLPRVALRLTKDQKGSQSLEVLSYVQNKIGGEWERLFFCLGEPKRVESDEFEIGGIAEPHGRCFLWAHGGINCRIVPGLVSMDLTVAENARKGNGMLVNFNLHRFFEHLNNHNRQTRELIEAMAKDEYGNPKPNRYLAYTRETRYPLQELIERELIGYSGGDDVSVFTSPDFPFFSGSEVSYCIDFTPALGTLEEFRRYSGNLRHILRGFSMPVRFEVLEASALQHFLGQFDKSILTVHFRNYNEAWCFLNYLEQEISPEMKNSLFGEHIPGVPMAELGIGDLRYPKISTRFYAGGPGTMDDRREAMAYVLSRSKKNPVVMALIRKYDLQKMRQRMLELSYSARKRLGGTYPLVRR